MCGGVEIILIDVRNLFNLDFLDDMKLTYANLRSHAPANYNPHKKIMFSI